MVQVIVDVKGERKTKQLLEMANEVVKNAKGTVVYLDKSTKYTYELSNKTRLIDMSDYGTTSSDSPTGFASGIISQDHDLEIVLLDSFLKLANLEGGDITPVINTLGKINEECNVNFVLSVSMDTADLPESVKKDVVTAL